MIQICKVVLTDGGTPCNIPRLGYGIGYGSYKIGDSPIVSLDFGEPLSNNAAEIRTMAAALEDEELRGEKMVLFLSDSQIALGWIADAPYRRRKIKQKVSPGMRDAIERIRALAVDKLIAVKYMPRKYIYSVFGH